MQGSSACPNQLDCRRRMRGDPSGYSAMAEEITYLDEELADICGEIRKGIDDITSAKKMLPDKREEKVNYLNGRISRARQVYHSFKVELRELNKDELREYEQKGAAHNQTISKLVNDLNWAKQAGERDDLLSGAKSGGKFNPDEASAMQIVEQARGVQDESMNSVARSQRLVDQAEKIGVETASKLKDQTDQMKRIYSQVDNIEGNLARADKIMREFVKRMATDKLVLCFILLILVGIITIVAWKATHKGGKDSENVDAPAKT